MRGIKKPAPSGSRPGVSVNVLTQPGAPPEQMRFRLTLRLAERGVIMIPHYYAFWWIRQACVTCQPRQFRWFPLGT